LARIQLPNWLRRPFASFALPSFAELENDTPLPLAAGAAVAALLLLEWVSRVLLGAVVGLGIVFVALFLIAAALLAVRFGVLYWHRRNP
jgi:hypothetical protein